MEFTYTHEETQSKGLFEHRGNAVVTAHLTYSRIDDHNIILDHTAVAPEAKGSGAGKAVVMHVVAWARKNDQKILPLCPFAKGVFERNPDIQDVLRK